MNVRGSVGLTNVVPTKDVTGYTTSGSNELFLFTSYVPLHHACVSDPPNVGPGCPGVFFEGLNPDNSGTHQLSWTFPILMVVEPQAKQITCVDADVIGYSDTDQITVVGAWGTER